MVEHICAVEGCETVSQRKVCAMHYERFRRNGHYGLKTAEERSSAIRLGWQKKSESEGLDNSVKRCAGCKVVKSVDEFYRRKDANGNIKPYSRCKPCHNAITNEYDKKWRAKRRAERLANKPEPKNNGICIVDGCERKQGVFIAAMCKLHYNRSRNGTDMTAPPRQNKQSAIVGTDALRLCTICDEVKGTELFYKRSTGAPASQCKACSVALGKVRQSVTRYHDIERALEFANSYNGPLKEKALAYIARHIEKESK